MASSIFETDENTSSTSTQTPPSWVTDYQQQNLHIGGQLANQPYQTYGGQRIAPQNQFQTQAINNVVGGMVDPFRSNLMAGAGAGMTAAGAYQPQQITGTPQVSATSYNPAMAGYAQIGPMAGYQAERAGTAQASLPAAMQAAQMQAYMMQGATPQVAARMVSRAGAGDVSATDVTAKMFPEADINQYLNPYTQAALDPTLREITRQGEMQRNTNQGRMAKAGAYGGSRHGVLDAEQQRNTGQLYRDTEAQGMQRGFDTAAGLITTDFNRKLQGDMATQAARLQAGISNQGNARAMNLAEAELGSRADLANAQMGFERMRGDTAAENYARAQNAGWTQGANQQNYQGGLQLNLNNASEANRVGIANAGYGNTAAQFTAGEQNRGTIQNALNQQQSLLANQTATNTASQFGATQDQAAQTTNAGNFLRAGEANQTAGLQGARLGLDAATGMGQVANLDRAMDTADFQTLFGIGQWQQGMEQNNLDMGYQDFLRQQQHPERMLQLRLAAMGNGGFPTTTTKDTSGGGTNALDLAALGLTSMGLANQWKWI